MLAADAATLAGAELEGPAVVVAQAEAAVSPEALLRQLPLDGAKVVRQEPTQVAGQPALLLEATPADPGTGGAADEGSPLLDLATQLRHEWAPRLGGAPAPQGPDHGQNQG